MSASSPIFSTDRSDSIGGYLNPFKMLRDLAGRWDLIWQFSVREVQGRYKGSYLGLIWAMINPLMMLAVYTFVFHTIAGQHWTTNKNENFMVFAMHMFIRIIAYNVFSESINRAPTLITGNPNYVKKVIFPLEILPLSLVGSAVFHSLLSVAVLVIAAVVGAAPLHFSLVYLPLAYVPLILLTVGLSWLLASLGVFLRDIGNVIAVLVQLLFFLTPITYPPAAVPGVAKAFMLYNPMALIVDNFGRVVNDGLPPNWTKLAIGTVIGAVVAVCGYAWFMKIKRAFADVI